MPATPSSPPFAIDLDGVSNLRDLGGYRAVDGRLVRRGLVFRSAALAGLTEADRVAIAALGLRTICDFRGVEESSRAPTRLQGPHLVALPIEPTVGAGLRDILQTGEATGEALFDVLARAYAAYAVSSQAQFGGMLDRIIAGDTPLLFHCAAGKDRTGFAAALLLMAVGVPWDTVVADYEATNRLWRRDTVPSADLPLAVRERLLRADPALLEAAFDAARAHYGSLDAYLTEAYDLGPERRHRLQDIMLEDA